MPYFRCKYVTIKSHNTNHLRRGGEKEKLFKKKFKLTKLMFKLMFMPYTLSVNFFYLLLKGKKLHINY